MSTTPTLLFGIALGIRHALEADHLAALGTLVPPSASPWAAGRAGALWGLGHGSVLVFAGGALVLLGVGVPAPLGLALDLTVAAMLLFLGLRGLLRLGATSPHPASTPSARTGRSAMVGALHGASGTGPLVLLVAGTLPSRAQGLVFLLLFSLASALSMSLATIALSISLQSLNGHYPQVREPLRRATGVAAIVSGGWLAWVALTGLTPS